MLLDCWTNLRSPPLLWARLSWFISSKCSVARPADLEHEHVHEDEHVQEDEDEDEDKDVPTAGLPG